MNEIALTQDRIDFGDIAGMCEQALVERIKRYADEQDEYLAWLGTLPRDHPAWVRFAVACNG